MILQHLNPLDSLSGENIDFKLDMKFVSLLQKEFKKIKGSLSDLSRSKDVIKALGDSKIEKFVAKATGLSINLIAFPGLNAYVMNPTIHNDSVIWNNNLKRYRLHGELDKITTNGVGVITVDISKGYVHGVEKVKSDLGLGSELLLELDVDELTAVFLHEIGHLIGYYIALTRGSVTNFLLQEFTDRLFKVKSTEAKVQLINQMESKGHKIKSVDLLSKAESKEEMRRIIITDEVVLSRSEFGASVYDQRIFEAIADQYVVKHGMYLPLAKGLAKITGPTETPHLFVGLLVDIISLGFLPIVAGLMLMDWWTDPVYDEASKRIEVIRKQAIASLKHVPASDLKRVLKDLDAVEELVGDEVDDLLLMKVSQLLIPSQRRGVRGRRTQQAIEHLSQSEANIASALFRTIKE